MKIAIIIPTFNEKGSIESLIDRIQTVFAGGSHDYDIVVVDANSPDGTGRIVERIKMRQKNVHLIAEKEKKGIGAAYNEGVVYALCNLTPDAFIEFDGDGQHRPEDIHLHIKALEKGYDYIIGSRYIEGGTIPKGWALYRKILSRFGSSYSRILLELPVRDVTSGFKTTRVTEAAKKIWDNPNGLLTTDYAYKIQRVSEMHEQGARICEVPIIFEERQFDSSKSTAKDIYTSLYITIRLRLRYWRTWKMPRIAFVGLMGFFIQTAVFEVLGIRNNILSPKNAALLGGELAILSNFALNNLFVFKKAVSGERWRALGRFHIASLGSILLQWLLIAGAERMFGMDNRDALRAVYFVAIILGFLSNYLLYSYFVFKTARHNELRP